jgi:lytic murein transglycosylase
MIRIAALALALVALVVVSGPARADRGATEAAFRAFLTETVWPMARAAGVSADTFGEATDGLTLDWSLPDLSPPGSAPAAGDAFQAEFRSPGRYLDGKSLSGLSATGRKLARRHSVTLDTIARQTGVPPGIVVAIWGRESAFGGADVPKDAIRTLATQAFMGARREIFLPEFVAALRILEADHLPRDLMKSSWAGAMGQPQFLPSKFLVHAVDGDGDGRRDIWTSVPDTLASIGRYLADSGWRPGVSWGAEVILPDAVPCTLEGPEQGRPAAFWQSAGVTRVDGAALGPADAVLHLMMPAGRAGPAFLVSENFYVLKRYNESDLYALFVGHLSDRIDGTGADRIAGVWAKVPAMTRGDIRDLQRRLIAAGHDVGGADGLVGFRTRIAIGREQERAGRPATCFPDRAMAR